MKKDYETALGLLKKDPVPFGHIPTKEEFEFTRDFVVPSVIDSISNNSFEKLEEFANYAFTQSTQNGYPFELIVNDYKFDFNKNEWLVIFLCYDSLMNEHRMKSGISFKSIEKFRHSRFREIMYFYNNYKKI